ncbi:hypothetical protein WSM22_00650 [Cytophagales bacterium WSM2-2]|nr:hypothetical protein WSM22_00650 [Cytophagales bacterium WSM2-2]
MTIDIRQIWNTLNRVLSIINGFLFGILGGMLPFYVKKGEPLKIPLTANVILLAVLILVVVAEVSC